MASSDSGFLIDFLAVDNHMFEHLVPVWAATPPEHRGMVFTQRQTGKVRQRGNPVVFNYQSPLQFLTKQPTIMMTHDCGETFGDGDTLFPEYLQPSSPTRPPSLFVPPGKHLQELQRSKFPDVPSIPIGCPKLDLLHRQSPIKPNRKPPVVAVTFTWDWQTDARPHGAFAHYKDALDQFRSPDGAWQIVGNAHPVMHKTIRPYYRAQKIPYWKSDAIMHGADVLIGDYSSILFEFASTGRPVILLNAPWYASIDYHNLRFWKCSGIGINVWEPDAVRPAIEQVLRGDPTPDETKRELLDYVYPVRDGYAAHNAAQQIINFCRTIKGV